MNSPVRILSDLHLGHKVSRLDSVESLRPLIAGAGTVIFNGDTWQELAKPFFARASELLGNLRALCREEGAEVIFLSGNHDPGWPGPGWVELAEGRIVVTHGDSLLFDGSPWKREILLHGERVKELWSEHPGADIDPEQRLRLARRIARELSSVEHPIGRHLLQRAWDAVTPPKRAGKMLNAWLTQGMHGIAFCERYFPKAEFLVIGHFHRPGLWRGNGRTVINTGSFMAPSRAHWVEWHNGWLSRGVVNEAPEACHKGRTLDVWRLEEIVDRRS